MRAPAQRPRPCASLRACLLVGTLVALWPSRALAANVRVRAGSRLEGRVELVPPEGTTALAPGDTEPSPSIGVLISGSVRDDVGAAIVGRRVSVSLHRIDPAAGAPAAAIELPRPERCPDRGAAAAQLSHIAPDEYAVGTDDAGAFCVRSALPVERATMKLRFDGDSFFDPASASVPVDLTRPPLAIAFDPEPRIVSLDRQALVVDVKISRPRRAGGAGTVAAGIRSRLTDERGQPLGDEMSDADGRVRFEVPTENLANPGPGKLRVEVDGAATAASASIAQAIERHARVSLEPERSTAAGVPEDGIGVEVRVRWARGAVASGSVEASIADQSVGAAAVRDGVASIAMIFRSSALPSSEGGAPARVATVALRYLPDAPWWEPGAPVSVAIPVRAASPWRHAPLALLAFVIAAWLLRGSWQPRWRTSARGPRPRPPPAEHGLVELVRPGAAADGWSGRVLDAHDGTALPNAVVSITVPSFPSPARQQAGGEIADARRAVEIATDAQARFCVPSTPVGAGARLRVWAPWHSTLEQPLPPPGELTVRMVSRRRWVLSRLVEWARRERGARREVAEPTPAEVASDHGAEVDAWARAVEAAAFGPLPVDERREQAVVALEPGPGSSSKTH